MTFAKFMHGRMAEANAKNDSELHRQLRLQQQTDRAPFVFYAALSANIQRAIAEIMAGTMAITLNKNKEVRLTTTEGLPDAYRFDCSNVKGVDLFAHLGTYLPTTEFAALQLLMQQNEIKKLTLYYQYDNGGVHSWNAVYATI